AVRPDAGAPAAADRDVSKDLTRRQHRRDTRDAFRQNSGVGLLSRLRGATAMSGGAPLATRSIASPWSTSGNMAQVVWHDVFGGPEIRVSRAEAMRVPAVVKGRSLIVGTLSRQPLRAFRHDEPMATQPAWLYRTNTAQSPQARLLWTLDDLIFEGCS